MPMLAFAALSALLPVAAAAGSDDDFRDGRIRYVENGVTVQRASDAGSEEAMANMPFLPGDRVWTDDGGRAEFQFADGTLLRLDNRSKLDYVSHEDGRNERVVLRLWSGGMRLRLAGRDAPDFSVETPGGFVDSDGRADLRIDAASGETRLSVYDGSATLDDGRGRRVDVQTGQRTYASQSDPPENPRRFDRNESDDFAEWNEDRDTRTAWAGDTRRYLPAEVAPYAGELESHGSWYYVNEVGNVWRPYVTAGWRPYLNGRWIWSTYGWTWVPSESWGWAPSHYGRWGYSAGLNWYWIPGNAWSPAWVSWAVGGDYVGWCPLGYRDVPVAFGGSRGYAVPRSVVGSPVSTWVYTRKGDLGVRDLARRRVEIGAADVQALRVVASPRARPTRDLQRIAEGPVPSATPRTTNIKPTIGDTVPELRVDPRTTIPVQTPRRTRREMDDTRWNRRETGDRDGAVARTPETAASPASNGQHPTDRRSPSTGVAASPRSRERSDDDSKRLSDPDREVLRRVFRPLSDSGDRERSGGGTGTTRTAAPRNEPYSPPPQHSSPPPQTAPPRTTPSAPPAHAVPKKDN